jgi:hypothetical protein
MTHAVVSRNKREIPRRRRRVTYYEERVSSDFVASSFLDFLTVDDNVGVGGWPWNLSGD